MAISRFLPRSLPRTPAAALINRYHFSSKSRRRAQLVEGAEIDQASSSSADPGGEAAAEIIALGIKRIEDAIHNIIVRRSAPDWLPFLPGYSYWVPPRASAARSGGGGAASRHRAEKMADVIGKLSALRVKRNQGLPLDLLSEDENMSFTSTKGWPASSFYIEGTSPVHPITFPVIESEATAKTQDSEDKDDDNNTSNSEDEEG